MNNTLDVQKVLNGFIDERLEYINTCSVGIITNTQELKNGFVTVKPLINTLSNNLESVETAEIAFVSVIMPSTHSSGLVIPVKKGDTCLLVFGKQDFESFKLGSDTPHDVRGFQNFSSSNAIAFVGFNITQESIWNPKNHSETYSETSVKLYNNKGTENECFIEMEESGVVNVTSQSEVNVNAPVVNTDDVIIRGVGSVKQFMLSHTHNYTDDGNLMVTAPPNPI